MSRSTLNNGIVRGARRFATRSGMSLVEVMISLAISATLLSAVAAAFSASAKAIEINDEFVRASQAARIGVNQVMAEVRKAKVGDAGMSGSVAPQQLEFTTDSGVLRTYTLDNGSLMMTVHDPIDPQTVRLAGNIDSLNFSTNGDAVSMLVTVKVGANKATLSGSAIPRRIMTFQ